MRRTRKVVSGTATLFLWSGTQLLAEYDGAGVQQVEYVYGSELSAVHLRKLGGGGAKITYDVHADQLGTPQVITNSSGAVAWRATFQVFGAAVIDPASSIEFNVRFPGQYVDSESNLNYNLFRYYSHRWGRYLAVDALGQGTGANLYAYAGNSPLRFVDPMGLEYGFWLEASSPGEPGPHISVGVGDTDDPSKNKTFSYGVGDPSDFSKGEVYEDTNKGGEILRFTKLTPEEAALVMSELEKQKGTKGDYGLLSSNCRHYSAEFYEALQAAIGAKDSPAPPRSATPRGSLPGGSSVNATGGSGVVVSSPGPTAPKPQSSGGGR
jgi:RHS repeat-associated protein